MTKSDDTAPKQAVKTEAPKPKTVAHNPNTRTALFAVVGVLVVVAAFLAGVQVADNQRRPMTIGGFGVGEGPSFRTGGGKGFRGRYGGGTNTQNGIVITGKVTNVSGNDFTVDQNGSSKTVKTDSDTAFRGVGIGGIKSGDQVSVSGSTNSDGSIQALMVSVGSTNTSTSAPASGTPSTTESF